MSYPSYEDIQRVRAQLYRMSYEHWIHDDLWSFNWWLLLGAAILPWVIWFKYVNKQRIFEIFSYGLTFGTIATVLDVWGVDHNLWGYPDKLLATIPPLLPADITVFPVLYSLIYQYGATWKKYLLYAVPSSALFAYIFEPLFENMEMYSKDNFTHTMSFLGFILLAVMAKWIMELLKKLQNSSKHS